MTTSLIIDIETSALPESELLSIMPPFDPAAVRCGNLRDPVKIADKIAEAESEYKSNYLDRAALDPLTGRVVAMGVLYPFDSNRIQILCEDDEAKMLTEFWSLCHTGTLNTIIGFNICLFDLPFLVRRSWKHKIAVPRSLREGRYWNRDIVDLRDSWQLGDRQAHGSLNSIAKHLGVGEKTGSGKDFAALLISDRAKAMEYLNTDLILCAKVAERMGVI